MPKTNCSDAPFDIETQVEGARKELSALRGICDRLGGITTMYICDNGVHSDDVASRMDNIGLCRKRIDNIDLTEQMFGVATVKICNNANVDVNGMAAFATISRELIDQKKDQLVLWALELDGMMPSGSYPEVREIISSLSAKRSGPRWVSNDTPRLDVLGRQ